MWSIGLPFRLLCKVGLEIACARNKNRYTTLANVLLGSTIILPSLAITLSFTIITLSVYPEIVFLYSQKEEQHYSFSGSWGSEGGEDGQLMRPHSIDVDSSGNVYVADSGNSRIQKFTSDGKFITKWGEWGDESGQFKTLHDVAVDPLGKYVYTIEIDNYRVQQFTSDGKFVAKWGYEKTGGHGALRNPHQVAVDSTGNHYLPDKDGSEVLKFDSVGSIIQKYGSNGTGNGEFKTPHGIAVDSMDNVYVTDMDNYRIQKFDSDGNFITKWGSKGDQDGQFSNVTPGIDVDPNGEVYVIDKVRANIQKFDSDGNFITKWGSKGDQDGQFSDPEDIAVNPLTGVVYVTDTGNSRVQMFDITK